MAPFVTYIGKRGSFIQFRGLSTVNAPGSEFTQPVQSATPWKPPPRAHIARLDDFGPEADLETLSSFTPKQPRRERHRQFISTIVPLGMVNTSPEFTEYRSGVA